MKNINEDLLAWGQIFIFVIIWFGVLLVSKTSLEFNIGAFKKLPNVVTYYVIFTIVFKKWIWKWPILQGWLIKYPNLEGTWKGQLETTWINPETGKTPPPIKLTMIIKQSFDTINCTLHTKESDSYSNSATLSIQTDSQIKIFSYNYTNFPLQKVRTRSEIHNGAAILKIASNPKIILKGEYWTDRKTTGSLFLERKSIKI